MIATTRYTYKQTSKWLAGSVWYTVRTMESITVSFFRHLEAIRQWFRKVYPVRRTSRVWQVAPCLLAVLILVVPGQLGGQASWHVTEGVSSVPCIALGSDVSEAFSRPQIGSAQFPMTPEHTPQSHALHHIQCQLAPSLTLITLAPLLFVSSLWPLRRLIPPQTAIVPRTPPPQFLSH